MEGDRRLSQARQAYAYAAELDAWWRDRSHPTPCASATPGLSSSRRNLLMHDLLAASETALCTALLIAALLLDESLTRLLRDNAWLNEARARRPAWPARDSSAPCRCTDRPGAPRWILPSPGGGRRPAARDVRQGPRGDVDFGSPGAPVWGAQPDTGKILSLEVMVVVRDMRPEAEKSPVPGVYLPYRRRGATRGEAEWNLLSARFPVPPRRGFLRGRCASGIPKIVGRKSIKRGPSKPQIAAKAFNLADEIRYIQGRAAGRDGRFVTVNSLVLFSTDTGDAWLLDPADHLAARLARDGDPEHLEFEETETKFSIRWRGEYRIEGDAFVYIDMGSGRIVTILGYPVRRIAEL